MSLDRIVTWVDEKPPKEVVLAILEDFLGGAAEKVESHGDGAWSALLHGRPNSAFRRAGKLRSFARMSEQHTERWFEVYARDDTVCVTTRMADEYTNGVAKAFVELICAIFKGRTEPMWWALNGARTEATIPRHQPTVARGRDHEDVLGLRQAVRRARRRADVLHAQVQAGQQAERVVAEGSVRRLREDRLPREPLQPRRYRRAAPLREVRGRVLEPRRRIPCALAGGLPAVIC